MYAQVGIPRDVVVVERVAHLRKRQSFAHGLVGFGSKAGGGASILSSSSTLWGLGLLLLVVVVGVVVVGVVVVVVVVVVAAAAAEVARAQWSTRWCPWCALGTLPPRNQLLVRPVSHPGAHEDEGDGLDGAVENLRDEVLRWDRAPAARGHGHAQPYRKHSHAGSTDTQET